MSARLGSKVAIVTGGDTGIGKAISLALASDGADVAIDYVGDGAPAEKLVGAIEALGRRAIGVEADISTPEGASKLVDRTASQLGDVWALVNNAGVEEKHPFIDTPFEVWQRIIAVDLTGPWVCSQLVARHMIERRTRGRIINISSVHEDVTMPTNAPYCAAKGGLRMLMRTIAVELARYGITVNNVAPGAVDTPIDADVKSDPRKLDALLSEIPLGRMGRPEEIASLVAFLASERADYITGATLFIDGGLSKMSGSL